MLINEEYTSVGKLSIIIRKYKFGIWPDGILDILHYVIMATTEMSITDNPLPRLNSTTWSNHTLESLPSVMFAIAYYCHYVFITIGTPCNILAVICLCKSTPPMDKNNTVRYYLIPLAVCDGLAIFWVHLSVILSGLQTPVYIHWETGCTFFLLMVYGTTELSSLLVMKITLNRFVAIFFPLKFKQLQSIKRIYCCIGILVALVISINWYSFGGLKCVNREQLDTIMYFEYQCRGRTHVIHDYLFAIFPFLDFVVYFLVPSLVLLVCNIAIARKLRMRTVTPVTNIQHTRATNVGVTPATNIQDTRATNVGVTPVTNIQDTRATNVGVTPATNIQVTRATNVGVTPATNIQVTRATNVGVTPATNIQVTRATNVGVTPATNIQVTRATNVGVTPVTNIQDTRATNVGVTPVTNIQVTRATNVGVTPATNIQVTRATNVGVTPATNIQVTRATNVGVTPVTNIQVTRATNVKVTPVTSIQNTRATNFGVTPVSDIQDTRATDVGVHVQELQTLMVRPLSVQYNVKDTAITVEGEHFTENYPSGSRSHLQCQSTMSPLPSQRHVWGNTSSQSDVTQGTVSAELHRASPPHQNASRTSPPQDISTVMQMPDQTHGVTRSAASGTSHISPITNTPSQSGLTKQSQRMTRISMVLSVSFLLLTFPQATLSLLIAMDLVDENSKSVLILVEFLSLLTMSNHALNFWLYCVYWKEFRKRTIDFCKTLFKTLCCCVKYVR